MSLDSKSSIQNACSCFIYGLGLIIGYGIVKGYTSIDMKIISGVITLLFTVGISFVASALISNFYSKSNKD